MSDAYRDTNFAGDAMNASGAIYDRRGNRIGTEGKTEPFGVGFKTPGLIDIRAFTTFGFNSKPNSDNPIGFFGTGLKYAIAVLMRDKIPLVIWIGNDRYEFEAVKEDFRGKEFETIWMKKSHGLMKFFSRERLPFTTEHGKNWTLWQAFRELESNTRDEGGETQPIYQTPEKWEGYQTNRTVILVGGDKFVDVYNNRDEIFLNKDQMPFRFKHEALGIEVYNQPSQFIYYRGMRVYDFGTDKISKYTYNFTSPMELTEDRTLKYPFIVHYRLADLVVTCDDEAYIKTIVESDKDSFEAEIAFDHSSKAPKEAFMHVMAVKKSKDFAGFLPRATSYHSTYAPPKPKEKKRSKYSGLRGEMEDWIQDYIDNGSHNDYCETAIELMRRSFEYIPEILPALPEEPELLTKDTDLDIARAVPPDDEPPLAKFQMLDDEVPF